MFYVNLITKQYIDESSIVEATENGLVYYENGCWKYLPNDKYEKVEGDSYSYTISVSETDKVANSTAEPDHDITKTHIFYTNYFGLNNLELSRRKYRESSGIVTNPIKVTANRPIKLKANVKANGKTSVEFFIVDGTVEAPILPQDETSVTNEKVFLEVPPRFASSKYLYYRDFKGIGSKLPAGEMRLGESLYTVNYTPDKEAYTYTPKGSEVRVKVILRMYDNNAEPPEVNNIVLLQEVS